ncbi:hypothetical protein BJ322DRAFT_1147952 [Thelephora terrestris]|uniref:Uncharacterized protein n=1 Tax=Thelephora terrestris TaxID=56493 RepID=A0A9P6H322_9AGAM|nr:hypothetical protein BJ322DRAFT_1147952 [Thelephora terrestris]
MQRQKVPVLAPSISTPTLLEVNENISHFFCEHQQPTTTTCGHSLLVDGVALEEKCRYLRSTDSVVGICREHGSALDPRVRSQEALADIEDTLHSDKPRAHYASEATVVAIAPFRSSSYSAIPVALSGSCKAETGEAMALWLRELIRAWKESEDGEKRHGPIWSIATDGESTMCSSRFQICMSQELAPSSLLYPMLHHLHGLNLFTGPHDITMTCDPKHIFKRFATLLRSREGLLIRTTVVNKNHLRSHLVRLKDVNEKIVDSLVDPADKQNVPKAVALIQHLGQLRELETLSYTPSQLEEHHALTTLAEVLNSFTQPFIDVQMSLTDQLTSLVKYAHLAFFLYQKHGTQFMTSPLYSDSQATVKDIFFCVAKQKLLDSSKPFYIIQVGSDRLEACFCNARTQTHHRNFDILELSYKLAMASVISSIYTRHPDLDAGSRRLNLTNAIGVDHVNPKSWIGDVTVDNVSIQLCWQKGKADAETFLSSVFPPNECDDPFGAFSQPDYDLLRPSGNYVGFSGDLDPSDEGLDDGSERAADKEVTSEEDVGGEVVEPKGILADDKAPDTTELEELLPDIIGDPIVDDIPKDWLEVDGIMHRKSSVVAQCLKANRSKKVTERTLRVQGLTLDDLRKRSSTNIQTNSTGLDRFCVGDVTATLVCSGSSICLVIIQVITIRKEKSSLPSVTTDLLQNPRSDVSVQAQAIQLVQAGSVWAWLPGQFLKISNPKKRTSKPTIHHFTIVCPGWLCFPVNPGIHAVSDLFQDDFPTPTPSSSPDRTWVFPSEDLSALTEHIWEKIKSGSARDTEAMVEALPLIGNLGVLPYKDQSGAACFVVDGVRARTRAPTVDKNSRVKCPLCDASVLSTQMRMHTGRHIIFQLYGMKESGLKQEISDHACGFCGGDECTTTMAISKSGGRVIESNCQYQHSFRYGAAVGKKSSCTNVPVHCPHCDSGSRKLTIWKYNAFSHIQAVHSNLIPNGLDKALWLDIQITSQEEKKMGLTPEAIEEFHTAERPLPLGNTELSSLKSEVEAGVLLVKKPNKHGRRTLDTPHPHVSTALAKKKKGEPGDKDPLMFTVKRKAAPKDSHTSTPPTKKMRDA